VLNIFPTHRLLRPAHCFEGFGLGPKRFHSDGLAVTPLNDLRQGLVDRYIADRAVAAKRIAANVRLPRSRTSPTSIL